MAIVIVGNARWLRGDEAQAQIPPRPAHCAAMASLRRNDREVCFTAGRTTSGVAKTSPSVLMPFSAAMPLWQFSRPRRHAAGHAEQLGASRCAFYGCRLHTTTHTHDTHTHDTHTHDTHTHTHTNTHTHSHTHTHTHTRTCTHTHTHTHIHTHTLMLKCEREFI
jgi:hypothetical protein